MTEIPQSNIQEAAAITSDNFTQYLINRIDRDRSSFPLTLDLSPFSDTFKNVFAERQTVPMLDDENLAKVREALSSDTTGAFHRVAQRILTAEAEAERACVIYLDPNSDSIDTGSIVHGEHTSVQGQVIPAILDDKFPLIDIHTHPDNSPFSPLDYDTLLSDLFTSDSDVHGRMVGALAVVGNNFQYLAVPTTDTPLVPLDGDVNEIINRLTETTENEERHRTHVNDRARKLHEHMSNTPGDALVQYYKKISLFDERIGKGEITFEEAMIEAKKLKPEFEANLRKYMTKLSNVVVRARNVAADYDMKLARSDIAEAPSRLGILLYRSSDFMHFEQFDPLAVTDQS